MADVTQLISPEVPAPTAGGTVAGPTPPPATAGDLIPEVSQVRYETKLVRSDATKLGRRVYARHLAERAAAREQQAVQSLLGDIADTGLSWRLMSRILGVSVPAIRKWRLGEGASPESRHAVARLAALLDVLDDKFMVEDPASWLEIPLAGTTRTVADIFAAQRDDLVLEYAARWITSAEGLLDEFDRSWRAEAPREFETFDAPDGGIGIRLKANG